MGKIYTKGLFLLFLFLLIGRVVFAQSIVVGNVDPGTGNAYSAGSTIAVPVTVDNTTGCMDANSTYNLYLSDASGNFASQVLIGTYNNFYATFVNGVIPAGTPAGTGYRVRVVSTMPAVTSAPSAAFRISAGAAVQAKITSPQTIGAANLDAFGACQSAGATTYHFENGSTTGSTVTATFTNELTKASEAKSLPVDYNAQATNYTIIVKATNGNNVGTKAYTLINNTIYPGGFTNAVQDTYCIGSTGVLATFNAVIDNQTHTAGLMYNYPSLVYRVDWGDGSPISLYTYCQLLATNGVLTHNYTTSSCGRKVDLYNNVFRADFTPTSPKICPQTTNLPSPAYVKIVAPAVNSFTPPAPVCTGTSVKIINTSYAGQDANYNGIGCRDNAATYQWYVDGVFYSSDKDFVRTFTVAKTYHITLRSSNTGACPAAEVSHDICVQDPPSNVNFTLPAQYCLTTGPLPVINNTQENITCGTAAVYTWTRVTGPADGVTFNPNVKAPSFTFTKPGRYTFQFTVNTGSCPQISSQKTIVVDDTPIATLPANGTLCSVNTPISFDPSPGQTQVIFGGTAEPNTTDTYTWTITNGATFAPGSNSHSQYPKIIFPAVGNYVVTVQHKNNCTTKTATEQIKVVNGPTVPPPTASPSSVCEGDLINLTGTPPVGGDITSVEWKSATTGGFFSNGNSPVTTYRPSAADIVAGSATLTYIVHTSLPGDCSIVTNSVNVPITRKATVTPPVSPLSICSNTTVGYAITSATSTSFSWMATASSAAVTGYNSRSTPTTTAAQNTIADVLINAGTTNATVTYTITPYSNGCPGVPYPLVVTVTPPPVAGTATATPTEICAGGTGNITLTGSTGSIMWQRQNADGSWTNTGSTSTVFPFPVLTQTTKFRANVTSGNCGAVPSNVITITVNSAPPPANANTTGGPNPVLLCDETQYQLHGNNPGTGFTGHWSLVVANPSVTIVDPSNPNTMVTGLQSGGNYQFRWTITGAASCSPTIDDITLITKTDITPDFEPSTITACGETEITLTNKSTPLIAGTVYTWDFGDGSPVSHEVSPKHKFAPGTGGLDKIYSVRLTIEGCTPKTKSINITISPLKPVVSFAPPAVQQSCGTLNLTLHNTSPGNNAQYVFYIQDENFQDIKRLPPFTDKSNAVFPPLTPDHSATWHIFLEATNNCGTKETFRYDIPVSASSVIPAMQFEDGISSVCYGTPVTFRNVSTGGDSFKYKVVDVANNQTFFYTTTTTEFTYAFPHAGHYKVSMVAKNNSCATDVEEAQAHDIDVDALPEPKFVTKVDANNKVTFFNISKSVDGTPKESFIYIWNFGDGSPEQVAFIPTPHQYDYVNSLYTVTLTAKSPSGCIGVYVGTLNIEFLGELFLPNAFQPASSSSELRTFKAKGQKLKEWNLQIFNNWGQLIWQTNKLEGHGSPAEGWDGTYKGQAVPQGVYVWQATAKFTNGAEWKGNSLNGSLPKRTGVIHLIR